MTDLTQPPAGQMWILPTDLPVDDSLVRAALDSAFPGLPECMSLEEAERRIRAALAAALPLHEQIVRARIAEEIRAPRQATSEGAPPEAPFDRLVRLTETHLRGLKATDFSAPLVDRLRRDDCVHDWSASKPLRGYDDEIECLECRLHVIDGYRPYYPKRAS